MSTLPSILLLITACLLASSLSAPCYVIVQSPDNLSNNGRRVRHYPTMERFTVPSKDRPLPKRIRFARNLVLPKRHRRTTVTGGKDRRYPYGIVPYTLDPTLTSQQRDIIDRTISVFENFTCIRFAKRVLDDGRLARDAYRLGHNGYVAFVNSDECFCSSVGNIRTKTRISCCREQDCLRLIGKALGQRVEHQSYRRDGFLRINQHLIPAGKRGHYLKAMQWEVLDRFPFDLSSPMNEGNYDTNGSSPVTLLTPDISRQTGKFYFFQEISFTHRCQLNNCSNFQPNCFNDGYVTLMKGQCTCRCPDGLDPKTFCATTLSKQNEAVDCGGVFNLTEDDPKVSFSANPGRNSFCTWLVSVPKGSTIILDFDEFDIAKSYGECEDWLEIRHSRIGQRGKDHCGKENPRSVTSYFNHVMLRLFTSAAKDFRSSFAVTARLVSKQNLCYNPEDKGYTYMGKVNYARDYSPCVPWWQVTHCQHHPYRFENMNAILDNNYCRNPGNGLKPWCYVNPKGCQRKYCDVCMLEKPFNLLKDCYHRVGNSTRYCTEDKQNARSTCAKECQRSLFSPQPSVARVTCGRPKSPIDGFQVGKRGQQRYAVGESVKFRCRHINRLYRTTIQKFCLSTGRWSHANSACLPCHLDKGWVLHGEACYTVRVGKKSADDHQLICRRHGANLVDIMSWEEQKFVSALVFSKGVRNYFIGANDLLTENKFFFRDFVAVSWTNWAPESQNGKGIDCVAGNVEGVWFHEQCHKKHQAVCKASILRHRRPYRKACLDFRDDCQAMLDLDKEMCDRQDGMFAVTQCAKTCGVC